MQGHGFTNYQLPITIHQPVARMQRSGIREKVATDPGMRQWNRKTLPRIPACGLHPGYKKLKSIFVASKNSMTAKIFFSVAPGVR